MAEISDILTSLLERSKQDKINWQLTANEFLFLAVLGKTSVTIEELSIERNMILRIRNQEGREIESLSTWPLMIEEQDKQLRELYREARRVALGVESQLDELLKELETGT
jgi:hypothetical protein